VVHCGDKCCQLEEANGNVRHLPAGLLMACERLNSCFSGLHAVKAKLQAAPFSCRIRYDTGEIEELDLTEVINDEQMYLLD
jgi:hypothetical protein